MWACVFAGVVAATSPSRAAADEDPPRLENPDALDSFYQRLAGLEDGSERGVVRVVNLGASSIGHDDLTGVLRGKFQQRFGDGGAGLVMMQRYINNYRHTWVQLRGRGWKNCFILYGCKRDGHYGLGGVTFESDGGASTTIRTRDATLGGTASHVELWYAGIRRGGKLSVRIDEGATTTISTAADALEDRFEAFDVPAGPHEITVRARGKVRAYGVVVETAGPGIVWDQFSMLAVPTSQLLRYDADHLARHVARRDPALLVFSYGGNDLARVASKGLSKAKYVSEFTRVVERARAGKPGASCLIVGIAERSVSKGNTLKPAHTELIVDGQREVARATGCAFFDAYAAMGGAGSFKAWRRHKPPLTSRDGVHLTHDGNVRMGGWIYDAILGDYPGARAAN